MSVKITYFVHGTTTDNENGLATGWLPGVLSEIGVRQAKELGVNLGEKKFDAVFCSDLQRAIDSAGLVFGKNANIIQDSRLRECNYGDLNGGPSKSVKNDMVGRIDTPYPNGESYKDVENRIADFLADLKQDYEGRCIAIVAHQAPQLALNVIIKGKTWPQAIAEDWRNTKSYQPGWEYLLTTDKSR